MKTRLTEEELAEPARDKATGVPFCSEDCRQYDGKRCRLLGARPDNICEPAVMTMASDLARLEAENEELRRQALVGCTACTWTGPQEAFIGHCDNGYGDEQCDGDEVDASDLPRRLEAANEKLRAERERMAKVVEAAERWDDADLGEALFDAELELVGAVRAYREGERIEPKEGGNG